MLLDRFRRSTADRAPRFAFYGKLPFDREFLRYHLDGPTAQWLVNWVHGAHEIMVSRRDGGDVVIEGELRVCITREGGREALTALVRPSRDGGGRSYPSCAFCVVPTTELGGAWHLLPLWLAPVWESMAINILAADPANRDAFAAMLSHVSPEPADATSVAKGFEAASTDPLPRPWHVLTGTNGDEGRVRATTFVQLGEVQRQAAGGHGSIVVQVPLNPAAAPGGSLQASAWLRLFAAVSAFPSAWPAFIEVRPRAGSPSICIFAREPTSEDLAYLLSTSGSAPIDDVREVWDSEPDDEEDRRQIACLIDESAGCLADLWRSLA